MNGAVVDELLARTSSGGTTAWYLTDKLGSVRDIVSSSGGELDHIVYDSFGNIVTQTDAANGDRFAFAGMEYDSITGQYYDHARYYDQALGRFTSLDPMAFRAGDVNIYRYVSNNPPVWTDPSGMDVEGSRPAPPPMPGPPPGPAMPNPMLKYENDEMMAYAEYCSYMAAWTQTRSDTYWWLYLWTAWPYMDNQYWNKYEQYRGVSDAYTRAMWAWRRQAAVQREAEYQKQLLERAAEAKLQAQQQEALFKQRQQKQAQEEQAQKNQQEQ